MIQEDQIQILASILEESCVGTKVVTRSELHSKFEQKTNSGMDPYQFKIGLTYLIKNRIIKGYRFKQGRNGGVYKTSAIDKITINCSSGSFTGYLKTTTLSRVIAKLKRDT